MDAFEKHKIAIAKKTLAMTDWGARIMGGMTKEDAREILAKHYGNPRVFDAPVSEKIDYPTCSTCKTVIPDGDVFYFGKNGASLCQNCAQNNPDLLERN